MGNKHPLLAQIQRGESKTLELKAQLPQNDQLAKTLVAFANTSGGKLVIGVNDDLTLKKNHLRLAIEISGLQRTESYEIPMAAIREALLCPPRLQQFWQGYKSRHLRRPGQHHLTRCLAQRPHAGRPAPGPLGNSQPRGRPCIQGSRVCRAVGQWCGTHPADAQPARLVRHDTGAG